MRIYFKQEVKMFCTSFVLRLLVPSTTTVCSSSIVVLVV
jgi:hypothetical protein